LCLKTVEEKKSWYLDLKKQLNRYRVFKVPIEQLMKREKESTIPSIVRDCVTFLDQKGLKSEGLFRISPNLSQLKDLLVPIDQGKKPEFGPEPGAINFAAEILKSFFRQLPEPILIGEKFNQWMIVAGIENDEEKVGAVKGILDTIPKIQYEIVSYLINFLSRISKYSSANKMTSANLAIVFSPLILYPRTSSFNEYMFRSPNIGPKAQSLLQFMIDNSNQLFVSTLPAASEMPKQLAKQSSLKRKEAFSRTTTVTFGNWNAQRSPQNRNLGNKFFTKKK